MKKRWEMLLRKLGVSDSGDFYGELHTLYDEPHRAYHTFQHIVDCLTHLDHYLLHHPLPDEYAVPLELAIWYHDVIYAPFRADNEEASAQLAAERLAALGLDALLIADVVALILITKHDGLTAALNETLMVDIDLAALGSSKERYAVYEAAIRQEYKRVPLLIYRRKRREILRAFLQRDRIYGTAFFYEAFEAQARVNLAWAIEQL